MTVDVHQMCNVDTPKADRRRMNIGDIFTNETTCLNCDDTIRSKNRHDFVTCSCGNVSVDGGSWYAKRSFKPDAEFIDNIVAFSDV